MSVLRQEIVGLYQRNKEEFARGMRYEKLTSEDMGRHNEGVPLWKDSGIAANWQSLPMPKHGDIVSGKKAAQDDLFGNSGVFVAGEFFMGQMPGAQSFVWHQRLISYSPTLGAIKRQIDDRFQHLLRTSEVYELSPDDIKTDAKFAIWYVEMPNDVLDINGPTGKSYTWQKGQSYAQVRHITQWVERALHAEFMRQQTKTTPHPLTVQYEWKEASEKGIQTAQDNGIALGNVACAMWYQPKEEEPELSEEEELSLLPCPMCHI